MSAYNYKGYDFEVAKDLYNEDIIYAQALLAGTTITGAALISKSNNDEKLAIKKAVVHCALKANLFIIDNITHLVKRRDDEYRQYSEEYEYLMSTSSLSIPNEERLQKLNTLIDNIRKLKKSYEWILSYREHALEILNDARYYLTI